MCWLHITEKYSVAQLFINLSDSDKQVEVTLPNYILGIYLVLYVEHCLTVCTGTFYFPSLEEIGILSGAVLYISGFVLTLSNPVFLSLSHTHILRTSHLFLQTKKKKHPFIDVS